MLTSFMRAEAPLLMDTAALRLTQAAPQGVRLNELLDFNRSIPAELQ
jgi:hypothetical protein